MDRITSSFSNDLKNLLEHHPNKVFIKNHALEIFKEAASIIHEERSFSGGFLKFVLRKLIKQTSPQEFLKICIKAIPSYEVFDPTSESILAEIVIIPVFKVKLNDHRNNPKF